MRVAQLLASARAHTERNAAVLDHISAPLASSAQNPAAAPSASPRPTSSTPPSLTQPRTGTTCSSSQPSSSQHVSNVTPTASSTTASPSASASVSQTQSQPPPISKHVLSSLFTALETDPETRYVSVENHDNSHFLYGLVLPLIARILAVSSPGLLCIVQLPSRDTPLRCSPVQDDEEHVQQHSTVPSMNPNIHQSSSSSGPSSTHNRSSSNSALPTSPSRGINADVAKNDATSAPNMRRVPTADAARHHQQQQQTASASASTSAAVVPQIGSKEPSPPPIDNSLEETNRTLRLLCNGFEVLTGKMPPPRTSMGSFTLATVSWEKAGVMDPIHSEHRTVMSFSNGMITDTEGLVVTFSNGSMCMLVLRHPLQVRQSLNLPKDIPTVAFTFTSLETLAAQLAAPQSAERYENRLAHVREIVQETNTVLVQIGRHLSRDYTPPSDTTGSPSHVNPISPGQTKNINGSPQKRPGESGVNAVNKSKDDDGKDSTAPNADKIQNGKLAVLPAEETAKRVPYKPAWISINAVPNAIPLFINTINSAFVDHSTGNCCSRLGQYGSSSDGEDSPFQESSLIERAQEPVRSSSGSGTARATNNSMICEKTTSHVTSGSPSTREQRNGKRKRRHETSTSENDSEKDTPIQNGKQRDRVGNVLNTWSPKRMKSSRANVVDSSGKGQKVTQESDSREPEKATPQNSSKSGQDVQGSKGSRQKTSPSKRQRREREVASKETHEARVQSGIQSSGTPKPLNSGMHVHQQQLGSTYHHHVAIPYYHSHPAMHAPEGYRGSYVSAIADPFGRRPYYAVPAHPSVVSPAPGANVHYHPGMDMAPQPGLLRVPQQQYPSHFNRQHNIHAHHHSHLHAHHPPHLHLANHPTLPMQQVSQLHSHQPNPHLHRPRQHPIGHMPMNAHLQAVPVASSESNRIVHQVASTHHMPDERRQVGLMYSVPPSANEHAISYHPVSGTSSGHAPLGYVKETSQHNVPVAGPSNHAYFSGRLESAQGTQQSPHRGTGVSHLLSQRAGQGQDVVTSPKRSSGKTPSDKGSTAATSKVPQSSSPKVNGIRNSNLTSAGANEHTNSDKEGALEALLSIHKSGRRGDNRRHASPNSPSEPSTTGC